MSTHDQPAAVPKEAASEPAADEATHAASVLERVLAHGAGESGAGATSPGSLHESHAVAWSGTGGMLADGRAARLGASCLLRPAPGDRVLVWPGPDGQSWVLGVLERAGEDAPAVLATPGPLAVEAPSIGITARAVHIAAEDFLTSTRNRHAVEDTRTESARVRVARIGTDLRRATTVQDVVEGTFLQRTGTWISNTVREARLRARAFLFD